MRASEIAAAAAAERGRNHRIDGRVDNIETSLRRAREVREESECDRGRPMELMTAPAPRQDGLDMSGICNDPSTAVVDCESKVSWGAPNIQ